MYLQAIVSRLGVEFQGLQLRAALAALVQVLHGGLNARRSSPLQLRLHRRLLAVEAGCRPSQLESLMLLPVPRLVMAVRDPVRREV